MAITLRGLKILEHPKTRPELWGVVVPWVRVQTVNGRAGLFDQLGRRIHAQWLYGGTWPLGHMEAGIVQRAVKRARRHALDTWQFTFSEHVSVSRGLRSAAIAAYVTLIACLCLLAVLSIAILPPDIFDTWHGIVALALVASVHLSFVIIGLTVATSHLLTALFGARRTDYASGGLTMHFDGDRVVRLSWQDVRVIRRVGGCISVTANSGSSYRLRTGVYGFVLDAHADQLDPTRQHRRSARATALRLILICQVLAIGASALLVRLRTDVPDFPEHLPLTTWLLAGVVFPLLIGAGFLLDRMNSARRGRRRVRQLVDRKVDCDPANPAG